MPSKLVPLLPLDVTHDDVLGWLQQVDPGVKTMHGGGGGYSSMSENETGFEYVFLSDQLDSDQVFSEVCDHIEREIALGLWVTSSKSMSNQGEFRTVITRGYSHYRVYLWKIPLQQSEIEWLGEQKKNATKLKWMVLGYSTRYAAKPVPDAKPNAAPNNHSGAK